MASISLASPGSILWCINWPKHPEKPRPVLVVRRVTDIDGTDWVLVVYGTGEKTSEKNGSLTMKSTKIEISSSECHQYSLDEATLFDFYNIIPLELTGKNFSNVKPKLKGEHLDKAIKVFKKTKFVF